MSQSDIQRMSFRLNEVVEEVFGVANLFEYFHTLELPKSIIFYHFKHFEKRYSVSKLRSSYESYRYCTVLQISVGQCMSQSDSQSR